MNDYEPDPDMLFNYLLLSALAEASEDFDSMKTKPSRSN